jgi:hypothetical protein
MGGVYGRREKRRGSSVRAFLDRGVAKPGGADTTREITARLAYANSGNNLQNLLRYRKSFRLKPSRDMRRNYLDMNQPADGAELALCGECSFENPIRQLESSSNEHFQNLQYSATKERTISMYQ